MNHWKTYLIPILYRLWRRRWIGVAAAWLGCMVGWVAIVRMPAIYEAQAGIYVDPYVLANAGAGDPERYLELIEHTLLLHQNLEKLISITKLDKRVRSPAEREALSAALTRQIAFKQEGENFISISYRNTDPVLARDVLRTLLAIYSKNTMAKDAEKFLDDQIADYERKLREAEHRRAAFYTKYFDILPGNGNASRLEIVRSELTRTKAALAAAQASRDELQQ